MQRLSLCQKECVNFKNNPTQICIKKSPGIPWAFSMLWAHVFNRAEIPGTGGKNTGEPKNRCGTFQKLAASLDFN